jgi:transcriptional regulator
MGEPRKTGGPVLPGTLDMLILKTVSREAMHGYAIAQFIQRTSQHALKVEEGALYPALHRLEVRGLLRAEWGTSDNNRRAKYYRLTVRGRRALDREADEWARLSGAVARIMQTT